MRHNRYLPPSPPTPMHEIIAEIITCAFAMFGLPFFIGFLCIATGAS